MLVETGRQGRVQRDLKLQRKGGQGGRALKHRQESMAYLENMGISLKDFKQRRGMRHLHHITLFQSIFSFAFSIKILPIHFVKARTILLVYLTKEHANRKYQRTSTGIQAQKP